MEPAIEETFDRLLAAPHSGPAHELIRTSLSIRIAVMVKHRLAYNILFAEAAHHPELAELLLTRVLAPRHQQLIAALSTAALANNRTRPPNPVILSVGLTAAIWAILGLQELAPGGVAGWLEPHQGPETLLEDLTDFVLHGLVGQPVRS